MRIKLLTGILITFAFFLLLKPAVHAQTSTPSSTSAIPAAIQATTSAQSNYVNVNSDVPVNLTTYTQSIFYSLASLVSCQLTGNDPLRPDGKCLGMDPITNKLGFVDGRGGAMGLLGVMISDTFYLPISTHQYGEYLASSFGIAQPTYAQTTGGLGFNALLPTLPMWTAFRNITYMIFTLLFVVIGIGIMFRVKIDPRTVMTLQNQIPRIIMALIFVTFSYAIAGFFVDLMYVSIYVIISVFAQNGFDTSSAVGATPFHAIGGLGGLHDIAYGASSSISGMVADFFSGTLGNVVGAMIGVIIGKMLPNPAANVPVVGTVIDVVKPIVGGLAGGAFGTKTVGLFAGIIMYLVIMIAMVSALIRLWFILIKSYLYVFLTVVFGPFYIATGVIPGKSGIGSWTRGMIANLAVFPATVVMFLLGASFISGVKNATSTPGGDEIRAFLPPLIGEFANPERMMALIGLGIILLTPEIANMIKEALKVSDLKQGAAIGKALQTGAAALSAPIAGAGKKLWGVNPYTNEPRFLTQQVLNRWGRGTSAFSKAVRGLTGTGKHYTTHDPQGIAEELRKKQITAERDRLKGMGMKPPSNRQIGQMIDWNSGDLTRRPNGVEGPEPAPGGPTGGGPTGGGPTGGGPTGGGPTGGGPTGGGPTGGGPTGGGPTGGGPTGGGPTGGGPTTPPPPAAQPTPQPSPGNANAGVNNAEEHATERVEHQEATPLPQPTQASTGGETNKPRAEDQAESNRRERLETELRRLLLRQEQNEKGLEKEIDKLKRQLENKK